MAKYYLLHYVGNKAEDGKPSNEIKDVCETPYNSSNVETSKRHFGIISGRKSALTIGVQYEDDGPIYDYCTGIETVKRGSGVSTEGKILFSSMVPISESKYMAEYEKIHSGDAERMNLARYAAGLREIALSIRKVKGKSK